MPTFTPPVAYDNPTFLPSTTGVAYSLFRHYAPRARGRTVILKTDGTAFTVDFPIQNHTSDPWTQDGWEDIPASEITAVFLGGHVYEISSAIATILTDAGYGAYIT